MSGARRRRGGTAVAALAAAAVAGSYLAVRAGCSERVDGPATHGVGRAHRAGADRVVSVATDLGSVYGLGGVALALALRGHRGEARDVAVSGAAAWAAAQAVKPLLERDRPYELGTAARLVARPAGSSWPSGHAAVAAAMARTLAPGMTGRGRTVAAVTAVSVGISRIHVGVHHLTDVVAGWGIGVLCAEGWQRLRRRPPVRRP